MDRRDAQDGSRAAGTATPRPGERQDGAPVSGPEAVGSEERAHDTVEAAVRAQLAKSLGGVRGIVEAAVPTVAFTITWIATERLQLSLVISIGLTVLLLLLRLVRRSSVQYVLNSLIGIGIGAFFATRTGQAKDVFLPGIYYNAGYAAVMVLSVVTRWPMAGFLIGSVSGDPTGWRRDPDIVKLCSRLTWFLILPCLLRVVVQLPLYYANQVAALGVAKVVLGWPLQIAGLAAIVWLLARGRTPINRGAPARRAT